MSGEITFVTTVALVSWLASRLCRRLMKIARHYRYRCHGCGGATWESDLTGMRLRMCSRCYRAYPEAGR